MNDLMKEILKLEDAWDFLYFYTITYSRILMNEILKLEDTIFYTCYNLFTNGRNIKIEGCTIFFIFVTNYSRILVDVDRHIKIGNVCYELFANSHG